MYSAQPRPRQLPIAEPEDSVALNTSKGCPNTCSMVLVLEILEPLLGLGRRFGGGGFWRRIAPRRSPKESAARLERKNRRSFGGGEDGNLDVLGVVQPRSHGSR